MKAFFAIACIFGVVVVEIVGSPIADNPVVNCDAAPPPAEGEEDWAVLVPNPLDCGSYYVCNVGAPIYMPCPEGLHFNPKLSVCDWPWAANCSVAGLLNKK
ncbi:peritrophin-1-like [Venturia canescens]|uniref:peritrophin-1-like n=1 Tax=Venturia canescens TaxID=32260 RepID=UPI001C9C8ED9|nr:peritrophin-1-like [Venturia canescens]